MDGKNENSILLPKNLQDRTKSEHLRRRLEDISLKDVPLDVRRKEAKKPLFLTRYE
jgi:hypothetical protein